MFEELNKTTEHNDTITPIKFMENSDVIYVGIPLMIILTN